MIGLITSAYAVFANDAVLLGRPSTPNFAKKAMRSDMPRQGTVSNLRGADLIPASNKQSAFR